MTEQLSRWLREPWGLESALFWFFLIACAAPIWCLSQIPTQDGPAHLYNAYLLSGWWKTSFPVDRTYFAFNPAPVPNWFSTVILAIFMQVFSPRIAEKILLTSYVILLPVAFRYASRSFDYLSRYTYFLSFALVWNHLFQMGFFNFCLSLVWYLFFIGYWARKRNSLGTWQIANLFLLSVLLYFSNGLSYYLAAATVGLLSIGVLLSGPRSIPRDVWWKAVVKPQLGLALALPLSILYFAMHGKNYAALPSHMTLGAVAWSVSRVSILVSSYNAIDLKLSALFGMVLLVAGVIACYSRRGQYPKLLFSDVLLIGAGGQFILYVVAPRAAVGGGLINYRVLLFALSTLALWIAIQPYSGVTTAFISAGATIIGLALVARSLDRNLWLSAVLDEYRAAATHIEEHKSLLPLDFEERSGYGNTRDPGLRYDPLRHAGDLLATERYLADLDDYEANSRNFPIVYREDLDPMRVIEREGPSARPPLADIAQYQRMTGRTVDYVLLWDVQRWNRAGPSAQTVLRQLSNDYVLIYCAQSIPLLLYRLRSEDSSASAVQNCPLAAAGE